MKVAIINSSAIGIKAKHSYPIYNLGAERIETYHKRRGDDVIHTGAFNPMAVIGARKIYFSVLFTWDIPDMIRQVDLVRDWGMQVEIGGPAATFMANYIEAKTGVRPHRGLDERFEIQDGNYEITFTSRGCANNCAHCGVRRVEPQCFIYEKFPMAPVIADNNILATPMFHQERVVDRFKHLHWPMDFNSGFDVRIFKESHFKLYSQLKLRCWRFAFDSLAVEDDVRRVADFMRAQGLDRHKVTFYVLIGFPGQTLEDCLYRLNTIIEFGHNVYPMRFWPLNSLDRSYVAPGWTEELLYNLNQYYQAPYNWRSDGYESFESFYPGKPKASTVPENQYHLLPVDC